MKFLKGGSFGAIATLVGITVGAGVLGMPYVMAKAGFLTGVLVLILLTFIMIVSSLYIGEVIQRTRGKHQLLGLTEYYLGKKGKIIISIFILAGLYGSLAAYTIASGSILNTLFSGGDQILLSILFWILVSIIILSQLNFINKLESIFSPAKVIILLVIAIALITQIRPQNLLIFNQAQIHIPLGVILFSLLGLFGLVEMNEELKNKKLLKKSIIIGIILSAVCYLIFSTALVGVMGISTPEIATTGLISLGGTALILINLFILLCLLTVAIALGFALKEAFILDYNLKNNKAWLLTILPPLIIAIFKPASFINLLGLTATFGGGLLIAVMLIVHSKAVKIGKVNPTYSMPNKWWIKLILIFLFVIATIYEIIIAFF